MKKNNSIRLRNSIFRVLKQVVERPSSFRLRFCLSWLMAATLVWQAAMTPAALANDSRGKVRPKTAPVKAKTTNKPTPTLQGATILYGPQRFDYQPGPARNVYSQFSLPITSPIAGTLHVQNGANDGTNRVSGAIIQLNGAVISTARTVNLNTATLDTPVNLLASNSLSVRIIGAPGSHLTITIFAMAAASPVIADFNPKIGPVGAQVTLMGTDLKVGIPNPTVTFAGANNTRLSALVSSATPTQVVVTVPNAAVTGTIELTNTAGMANSPSPFFVEATQDFQITSAPTTATTIQGSAATFVITLTSQQPNFTQLATLSV